MQNKRGKVAIIFGASRGIGYEIALKLSRSGYAVSILSKTLNDQQQEIPQNLRQQGTLQQLKEQIQSENGRVLAIQCDVRDVQQIQQSFQITIDFFKDFGIIDLIVYNSGSIHYGTVEKTDLKRLDLLYQVNTRGCYAAINVALPYLKQQKQQSRIIVVSPPIYQRFFKGKTTYSMSKIAMSVLVRGLSFELQNQNISVVSLWPATGIKTAATDRFGDIDKLLRKPSIFAEAVLKLSQDENIKDINGQFLIDEDYLKKRWGVENFEEYRVLKDFEPPRMMPKNFPDLLVNEENDSGVFDIKQSKL